MKDCMRARDWLIGKGFKIDMADPIPHSKFHYELSLNGKLKVGLLYNLRINLQNGVAFWFDDSQSEGTGNVESNDSKIIVDIGHSRKNHIKIRELEDQINKTQKDVMKIPIIVQKSIHKELKEFKEEFSNEFNNNFVSLVIPQMGKIVGTEVSAALNKVFNNRSLDNDNRGENLFI